MFIGRSASPHASAFSPSSSGHKTLSYFLDEGCRDDVDAIFFRFFYACGIPFNVLRSPYWHEMLEAKSPDTSLMGQVSSVSALSLWWHATVRVGHCFNTCHHLRTPSKTVSDTIQKHVLRKRACGRLKRGFPLSFSCFISLSPWDIAVWQPTTIAQFTSKFSRISLSLEALCKFLLEYRRWCAHFTIDDTFVTQP